MRKYLQDLVILRYLRPVSPLDEVFPHLEMSRERHDILTNLYDDLNTDKISIHEYVKALTDEELIAAYDSQCRLEYR
jgi:hypothetical protein